MVIQEIIESYQKHFNSSIGVYVYLYLNQNKPEFFSVHSDRDNNISEQIENICKNANNLDDIINNISIISDEVFNNIQDLNSENKLTKPDILKVFKNIAMLDLKSNDWESISGLIEFNEFSAFINDKKNLQRKLKELANHFSMKSISVNPNYNPDMFCIELKNGIEQMCDTLGLKYNQIGLNALELNFRTEQGDFTGYVSSGNNNESNISNKMVINKLSVFAHEWMHFIESSLGMKNHSLTDIMSLFDSQKFTMFLPHISNVGEFPNILNKKEDEVSDSSEKKFILALISASHFFEPYALNKKSFNNDIENIAKNLYGKIKNNEDNIFEYLQLSIKDLLSNKHPTRYFSFLEAQCEQEKKIMSGKILDKNQFIDFSKQADKRLNEEDYSASLTETFARSFEQFLFNKINNPCSVLASSYDSDFYPQGKMKGNLNDFWSKSWIQIKDIIDIETSENQKTMNHIISLNNIREFRKTFLETKEIKHNI